MSRIATGTTQQVNLNDSSHLVLDLARRVAALEAERRPLDAVATRRLVRVLAW